MMQSETLAARPLMPLRKVEGRCNHIIISVVTEDFSEVVSIIHLPCESELRILSELPVLMKKTITAGLAENSSVYIQRYLQR